MFAKSSPHLDSQSTWSPLLAATCTGASPSQLIMSVFAPDLKITARASYYGQHLLFVDVASFVDNNCPGDNFFYIFSPCRFTTLLFLLWTPCSCQRPRCGPRCCPPRPERLLPLPGIVYNIQYSILIYIIIYYIMMIYIPRLERLLPLPGILYNCA